MSAPLNRPGNLTNQEIMFSLSNQRNCLRCSATASNLPNETGGLLFIKWKKNEKKKKEKNRKEKWTMKMIV